MDLIIKILAIIGIWHIIKSLENWTKNLQKKKREKDHKGEFTLSGLRETLKNKD